MKRFLFALLIVFISVSTAWCAAPTTEFRLIPQATTVAAIDTAAERLAAVASESSVSTGVGNEVDFGTVVITDGAADSDVKTIFWGVTADGGNTTVDTFKVWMSSNGFDIAGTVLKLQPLSGDDQASPSDTENYIVNAVVASYTWATMPETEPGAQNVWPSDEGSSMALSTAADDVVMFAVYLAVASGETVGIYKGTDTGLEFQLSFKYNYS